MTGFKYERNEAIDVFLQTLTKYKFTQN